MAFENGVYGSAESAKQLASSFKTTMLDIMRSCEMVKRYCASLSGAWDDEGLQEAETAINQITRAIENCAGDYGAVYRAILAYAEFLSTH